MKGSGVLTGRSGSIGKFTYIEGEYWPHNTALYVKDFHGNSPKYIFYLFHTVDFKRHKSGVSVPTLNRNFIHEELVGVAKKDEQDEIVKILNKVDEKISWEENKNGTLSSLFKSMLQLFMTGQVRVKDIDFGEIHV